MRHVLYVDDEAALCKAFERALRGTDVQVITTTSAPHALELLTTECFDVVASDLRMPQVDGLMVLRAARAHDPCTRRLLVSGQGEADEGGAALRDESVDEVVCKPWSLDELRHVVHRAAAHASLARRHLALERLLGERTREARDVVIRILNAHAGDLASRCADLEWDALVIAINERVPQAFERK